MGALGSQPYSKQRTTSVVTSNKERRDISSAIPLRFYYLLSARPTVSVRSCRFGCVSFALHPRSWRLSFAHDVWSLDKAYRRINKQKLYSMPRLQTVKMPSKRRAKSKSKPHHAMPDFRLESCKVLQKATTFMQPILTSPSRRRHYHELGDEVQNRRSIGTWTMQSVLWK